jgi:tRNA uridine 5-carboxymethylaminomethyl modification enzyme
VQKRFDVIVVGGGHAGAEAAWAAANLGAQVALVTLDPARMGVMPCNPSIGGLAKGQIVREIDALGGLMGLVADATGIMFKVLNTSRGPAVRGPRCQCDKHAYAETVQSFLQRRTEITIIAGSVESIDSTGARIRGVTVRPATGERFSLVAPAVVLTTGTFMRGLMHCGAERIEGGRHGEGAANTISAALRDLGFELNRLKTGTPPRLRRSTIDWSGLEAQHGDADPIPFSDLTTNGLNPQAPGFPAIEQVECRVSSTNAAIHDIIRDNLHLAPMYNGQIDSAGPRYCPSIEDKVVRFADRDSHHIFLEPESLRDESVYCNGISTSLPAAIQQEIVRRVPGCERAEILQPGYAVEYDMVPAHQIDATCMTKRVHGLFLAGQINGTSGYEEAAGQGLLAGLNAARCSRGDEAVTLGRDQAYIGVMMDDLVTKTPVEPYRMFTSRAEHRLLLRADNASDRLTPLGREWGLVDEARWRVYERRAEALKRVHRTIDQSRRHGESLATLVKRPGFDVAELRESIASDIDESVLATALADRQYAGYIARHQAEVKRQASMEHRRIPATIDYAIIQGLRAEARESLTQFRPATFGQASRLEGVTPADLSIILIEARRARGRTNVTMPPD